VRSVQLTPQGSRAANYGFDVTPARLVTGLITERGVVQAEAGAMQKLR
jgi:methylthioribose-1-phosphate isomerase